MVVVSEFAWCVYSLLNIYILAWKFLNLTFDGILHEMLRLIAILHLLATIHTRQPIRTTILIWERHFLLFLECILSHRCDMVRSWERRRWLHSNTASRLPYSSMWWTELRHILHFIIILGGSTIVLDSRIASTICQAIMHYLPAFSLILHASYLVMRPDAPVVLICHLIVFATA